MSDINCCPKCGNEDIYTKNLEVIESESNNRIDVKNIIEALLLLLLLLGIIADIPNILFSAGNILQAWSNTEIIHYWANAEIILRIILVMIYSVMGIGIGAVFLIIVKYSIQSYKWFRTKMLIVLIGRRFPENKYICKSCGYSWNNN